VANRDPPQQIAASRYHIGVDHAVDHSEPAGMICAHCAWLRSPFCMMAMQHAARSELPAAQQSKISDTMRWLEHAAVQDVEQHLTAELTTYNHARGPRPVRKE
jgi:hypothetical protein